MDQEKQKVKIYSAEFRESSVKLAIGSDKPITQTAKDLGVNANTLHKCTRRLKEALTTGIGKSVGVVSAG